VEAPPLVEPPPPMVETRTPLGKQPPNMRRLKQLRADIDLNGNRLEVGCNVRFYSAAYYIPETDTIGGIELTDEFGEAYDGVLEEIGVITEIGIDRKPQYVIRVKSLDFVKVIYRQGGQREVVGRERSNAPYPDVLRPIVNGMPIMRCVIPGKNGELIYTDKQTCPQFAVFRL
jgi:hypothetical protein